MDAITAPVSLLILTSKEEEAERIITTLRNGGLSVHGVHADELLEDFIVEQDIALILCCEYDPKIDLEACIESYQSFETDVPLVVIADMAMSPETLIHAMRRGVRDVVRQDEKELLQLVVARELSDLKNKQTIQELQDRLEECEQRSQQAMNASGEAVAFIHEGMHVQANPAYCELFGFETEDDLIGYTLLDLVADESQQEMRKTIRSLNARQDESPLTLNVVCVRTDDTQFNARMVLSKSSLDGEPCIRAVVQQIGDSEAEHCKDQATGLANYPALIRELAKLLQQDAATADRVGIIYVGVQVFDRIVQNEGFTQGLKAMGQFGTALQKLIPAGTFAARVCDDGFVILLKNARDRQLLQLSSLIVEKIRLPAGRTVKGDQKICNTGAVLAEPGHDTPEEALNTAYRDYLFGSLEEQMGASPSSQMPASKQPESGYSSEMSDEDKLFAAMINRALTGDGFQLVYQPIVSLKGDAQENYNVFIRLRDDQKRLREAKDFLSVAVRAGRMVAVDRWVIEHAIEEVAKQRAQGRKVNFFINLAQETLQEEKLLIWICDQLRRSEARGNWFTFQVMEDHARRHSVAFSKLQEGLKRVKCNVALNRFGQGPSPEVLLRNIRTDFVKFMPELGNGLADDEEKQQRLIKLIEVAQELEVRTVVTGVEDARTLTVLWQVGVDYVQGNFLGPPAPTLETPANT